MLPPVSRLKNHTLHSVAGLLAACLLNACATTLPDLGELADEGLPDAGGSDGGFIPVPDAGRDAEQINDADSTQDDVAAADTPEIPADVLDAAADSSDAEPTSDATSTDTDTTGTDADADILTDPDVCTGDVCESGCTGLSGVDTDGDGVCDDRDRCPAGDDALDEDGDGTPDACEECPAGADTDADGVVDVCDVCPGADDLADADGDGICDARDICSSGSDTVDADGDTVPDACDVCVGNDRIDSDADTIPNACDTCEGFDDRLDRDGDGVADGCDRCPGGDDSADTDRDGVCDAQDRCLGIDSSGDVDSDGVCNNEDPCVGANATGDSDADGLCNDRDACVGDDATGDTDADGICDSDDVCQGNDRTGDSDLDGVCNDRDDCIGNDATGDSDGDNVCNDRDDCVGNDATGDVDGDNVCNDLDDCVGNDATGDPDNDQICTDRDLCFGDNSLGDANGDGICDVLPGCTGDRSSGDSDADGVCNNLDNCVNVANPAQQDTDVTGEWATAVPIGHLMRPSPANTVTLGDDAVSAAIPLGFTFPWFGTSQSQIQISSNGFIYVGTSAETSAACCSGPPLATATVNNIVALYWDDLNPLAGGTIRHGLVGTQYPREYVIEFNAINRYAYTDPITAQIILREDGAIELQCADCSTDALSTHTQGVRGLARGFAVPGRDATDWRATASGYLFVTGTSAGPDGVGDACDTCAQVSSTGLATPARWAVAPAAVSVRGRPAAQGPAIDDHVTAVSLGFTASTLGDSFSTVSVSSNGLLYWGASTTCFSCIGPFDIFNPGDGLNGYAAVYNEDLNPSAGGSWWYGTQGASPNREFVLSYEAIPHYSVGQPVTAQIVIREADSSVELICVNCPSNGGDTHTQGVENAAGTLGLALGGRARSSTFSPVNDAVRVFPVACQP